MSPQTLPTSGKVFRVKFRNQVDKLFLVPIGSTNTLSQEGAKLAFMQAHFPKFTETNYDFTLYRDDLREYAPREEVRANSTVYFARVPATQRKVWLSAEQKEQLEAAKSAKADPRPSFEEAGVAWQREMRRWQTRCKICHQRNSHTTSECFYGKNFDGAKRASGIPRSMLQAVAPGTSNVVVDTFGVASQTRVQLEAYREAEKRRYKKVNNPAKNMGVASRGSKMFSSGVVPDSLKCPACEKLLCVPQKMTPCGCVVCLDCSDSVAESQLENMQCSLCKKLLHETPDYVNDEETQQRLQSHLHCGRSGAQSSSGVSSDDSEEKTETDVTRSSSTEESGTVGDTVDEMVRAPKRKAVMSASKEVAPPPTEFRQQIEVVGSANSPRLSPMSESLAPGRTEPPAHFQPLPHPEALPDFDPLAAFNDFLASKDKRDKEVKDWLQVSRQRRDEFRYQRRHYYDEVRHPDHRRSNPYYRR